MTSVGKDVEKLELSCIAGRNVNAAVEDNLAIPQ